MKRKYPSMLLCISISLTMIVSCGPAVLPQTNPLLLPSPVSVTPTVPQNPNESLLLTAQMGSTLAAMLTGTAVCNGLCPSDSMTMTAAMAATFAANPTNTPPVGAAVTPIVGDLGWGSVHGRIIDGNTYLPLVGATIKCVQASYNSQYLCNGFTVTDTNGMYVFNDVYFHDTDRIYLDVEAPGYTPLHFEEAIMTQPDFHIDLGLLPAPGGSLTPTQAPIIMCTPPACSNGVLACGSPNGCPGGCGTVCVPASATP